MAIILWGVWIIGFALAIWMAFAIRNPKTKLMANHFLIIATICIIIVGGIIVGKFAAMSLRPVDGYEFHTGDYVFSIIFIIIGMVITYLVGYAIIGLYLFEKKWEQIYFVVVFIISVIGWSAFIFHCNNNVETIEQSIPTTTENLTLVYFCNIPVQNIEESSSENGVDSSETITVSENVSYWYLNGNGEAVFGTANAKSSKIVFIGNDEEPYVTITNYESQKITIDHNIVEKQVEVTGTWTQYVFYLPEAIKGYTLR